MVMSDCLSDRGGFDSRLRRQGWLQPGIKPVYDKLLKALPHPLNVVRRVARIPFRETRARCMGLTVNQWLEGFDSLTRSQYSCKKKTLRPKPGRAVCQLRNSWVRALMPRHIFYARSFLMGRSVID